MKRFRRLRTSCAMRRLVRETELSPADMIYPVFVAEGKNIKEPIESMPGIYRHSIDKMEPLLREINESGIGGVLIFGVPLKKDETASGARIANGIAQRAARHIKEVCGNIVVIADICLCEYTSHGHCGVVKNGEILNDETLPLLAEMSVTMAQAGADIIAPSDMMDGRVGYIRQKLDENGFTNTPIMSYSAKFASAYYGPFREAAGSAPAFGDRKTYQMDFHNGNEAMREIACDIEEGCDIIMVKPALAYLDIIRRAACEFNMPLAAYNVSGEYSMVKAASANGWIDERRVVTENLTAMKRAGAKMIITYHALDMAKWLNEKQQF
ncbi:MAG: porphobilinogen synthase [Firmicutes bacterium]|nr:porphobilinogen synthase [Bacillota bacterium]